LIVSHPASLPFKPPDHSAALVDDENRMPAGLWEIHAYMPFALRGCNGEGAWCRGIALAFDLALGCIDRPLSIESRSAWSPEGDEIGHSYRAAHCASHFHVPLVASSFLL
jgi:hypothetical protein